MKRGARRDGIRPELIRRVVIYGLLLPVLAVAESAFFARLHLLPATPDLMLGAVVAVMLLDSRRVAAVVGIAGGFLADCFGSVGLSLSPILYLLVVLTVGALAEKMLSGFPAWLILMLPALLLRALWTFGEILLLRGSYPPLDVLRQVLLPELICTLILCLPLFGVVKLCTLPLRRGRDRSLR